MSQEIVADFAALAAQVVGEVKVNALAEPYPWFCQDIFRKKDLQWAGYVGPIGGQKQALVFGLNLEFTPAWRLAHRKIFGNLDYFSQLLSQHRDLEWHWWGRPGVIAKNPGVRILAPRMWTYQVDVQEWICELEDILTGELMWSAKIHMRPQVQVMRQVGLPSQLGGHTLILQKIQQTVRDLQPLVDFIVK